VRTQNWNGLFLEDHMCCGVEGGGGMLFGPGQFGHPHNPMMPGYADVSRDTQTNCVCRQIPGARFDQIVPPVPLDVRQQVRAALCVCCTFVCSGTQTCVVTACWCALQSCACVHRSPSLSPTPQQQQQQQQQQRPPDGAPPGFDDEHQLYDRMFT
jgi:hypothetical protein